MYVITIHQHYRRQTDGRTDRLHSHSNDATHVSASRGKN